MKRQGRAAGTILKYRPHLDAFAEWAGERELDALGYRDLEEYLDHWHGAYETRRGKIPASDTMRGAITALRAFYAWAERMEYVLRNPARALEAPKGKRKPIDWLREEDDRAVMGLEMILSQRTLIFFLRLTGVRIGEALSLTNRNIDTGSNTVYVLDSKTASGVREIPIAPELRPTILAWKADLQKRGLYKDDGFFFVTRNGTPWSTQQAEKTVEIIGKRAGLSEKLYPHKLRKTFGSSLLNKGVRLETVSKLLGHSNTAVTERSYAELTTKTIRDEFMRAIV